MNRWDKALHAITDELEGKMPIYSIFRLLISVVKQRRDILSWISDQPFEQYHDQAKSEVLSGTGTWLLHDSQFIRWKNECASSILWLYGIPGSGKSKLV
jgi:hypothetical protein